MGYEGYADERVRCDVCGKFIASSEYKQGLAWDDMHFPNKSYHLKCKPVPLRNRNIHTAKRSKGHSTNNNRMSAMRSAQHHTFPLVSLR